MCSETTANYGLPHYLPSDHPDFLVEINKAYTKIDEVMKANAELIEEVRVLVEGLTQRTEALETAIVKE